MKKYLNLIIILISGATIISGLVQMIKPSFVLSVVGAETSATSAHFFSIVGMFMTLFGGLMLHALYSPYGNRPAALWCSLQKFGASVAVGLGVINGIFSAMALGVAVFDLFSGIILIYYFTTLNTNEEH